jgi:predicted secreted protein
MLYCSSYFRKMKLIFCFLMASIIISCNEDETPEHTRFTIDVNERFTVKLKSNVTTGYQWFLIGENPYVDSVEQKYRGEFGGNGAGGMEYWTFQGKEKGIDTLRFIYVRELNDYDGLREPRKMVVEVR